MLELFKFIFQDEIHFFGTVILIYVVLEGINEIFKTINRTNKDKE